jgi:hypothetical protein
MRSQVRSGRLAWKVMGPASMTLARATPLLSQGLEGLRVGQSARFFRVHDEEAETLHPQVRFGVCRLGVKALPASCERYEPRRVRGGC